MFVEERRERAAVLLTELLEQLILCHRLFHEERIDQYQAILHELEAEGCNFLLLATIPTVCPSFHPCCIT
jgi:hypothetical protein